MKKSIGPAVFGGCSGLMGMSIPNRATRAGNSTFLPSGTLNRAEQDRTGTIGTDWKPLRESRKKVFWLAALVATLHLAGCIADGPRDVTTRVELKPNWKPAKRPMFYMTGP